MASLEVTKPPAPVLASQLHDLVAEQAILGGLMLASEAFDHVQEMVAESFFLPSHQALFRLLNRMHAQGEICDAVTVGEAFRIHRLQDQIEEGISYLIELCNNAPGTANLPAYVRIVQGYALRRQLYVVGGQVQAAAAVLETPTRSLCVQVEALVANVVAVSAGTPATHYGDRYYKGLEARYERPSSLRGLSTGFPELDTLTLGLCPNDLVVIAAPPSHGKTALGLSLARHTAVNDKKAVAVFSMEMSRDELLDRCVASLAHIPVSRLRTGQLRDEDWPTVLATLGLLEQTQLHIDDRQAVTVSELRARARQHQRRHGLDLIVVDHFQLLHGDPTENARALKRLARELGVPLVVLAQVPSTVLDLQGPQALLAALEHPGAGAGSLAQDADLVLFLRLEGAKLQVTIGKQRNGPTGQLQLQFDADHTSVR